MILAMANLKTVVNKEVITFTFNNIKYHTFSKIVIV